MSAVCELVCSRKCVFVPNERYICTVERMEMAVCASCCEARGRRFDRMTIVVYVTSKSERGESMRIV